ncbi:hypothetical protein F441_12851 [Phytophthora nicotianae CJ01A1]|uniref:Uncharacterized protein n=4 Tax=Phytophthora nicotianae TaxID=4792 RepID=W2R5S4_PHYN3|nr:hypothetical protein PPTG_02981 [Phytophthora nicotianae INRA-310]ETI41919.1 hypothetical protein F443_12884 [Phytophthora nicotianae P1569]ETK81950.1 hypothetical protein L915_12592 [Phytophthora nicotianae]ETP11669.1 hypothetical protein F441_12851 [Phytophthora nicotianae CJ01A1]ETL35356.1 hypothetical protein L916_12501 [Phytophthora nicotianae]ETL88595.1 hypothetical protein L917_12340 [Phytophthora nicotianae]
MSFASCQTRPKRVRGERQRLQDARWRQSKKQERQQLEETAQQLETQLEQLQQSQNPVHFDIGKMSPLLAGKTATSPQHKKRKSYFPCTAVGNGWQAKAESMKQQRVEAELLNTTLRRALVKEQKVAKSLKAIMNKRPYIPRSIMYEMRRASCSQTETRTQTFQCSQCCNPTTLHINPTVVRREIEATLQRMHTQANAVLSASGADNSLSFNFKIHLDPGAGPTTEVTTTTPMNCGLDHAVKLLGPNCCVQKPVDLLGARCVPPRRRGNDAHVQQFTVELGAPYQTLLLDGFGSTRKSDDGNQRLILWAAISFDRCGALCFRECTWLAVRRSPSDPVNESVIRSHYSVAAEKAAGCTVIDGESIDSVRDRALCVLGKQIKERYLAMQRGVLLQTGRGDLVSFVGA